MLKCKYYSPNRFVRIIMLAFDMVKSAMYRLWLLWHWRLYFIVVSWATLNQMSIVFVRPQTIWVLYCHGPDVITDSRNIQTDLF